MTNSLADEATSVLYDLPLLYEGVTTSPVSLSGVHDQDMSTLLAAYSGCDLWLM